MQVKNINVQELLNRLRSYFLESDFTKKFTDENALKAELFNAEQLEQHGRYLARTRKAKTGIAKDRLLKRLAKNEKILVEVRNLLTETIKEDRIVAPAGEWLLDNFYLIQDHINTGKRHLPKGYSEGLPRLVDGGPEGKPRVYDLALELVAHTDGRIDMEGLNLFISAYQSVAFLQLGELWAIPIMLRLALIENLSRICSRVAIDRVYRNLAEHWAGVMKETAEKDPKSLILMVADMARSNPPMESSFVAEMVRQLMWMGPALSLPLTWMEQRLSEMGLTTSEQVIAENQKQAADQVSVSNSIGSLRLLGTVEWHEFVEQISVVERTLRGEASGIYPLMAFVTRDRYRHIIERIAKYSSFTEPEVAKIVVELANNCRAGEGHPECGDHVGYYLAGDGLKKTESVVKRKFPFKERVQRSITNHPLIFYAGSIILLTLAASAYIFWSFYVDELNHWVAGITVLLTLIGVSQLATSIVNWLATLIVKPDPLPRMDFSNGIPQEYTTLVVVPTMLASQKQNEQLLESLEVRYLANKDSNLLFGLLTDFLDANVQVTPKDENLLRQVTKGIEALNKKYGNEGRFYLFHRPRKWNPYDKIWMGYERKRGKLAELNELLRGRPNDNFSAITGDAARLQKVRYVITLDTDTQFPRDAGWELAATMAHPLNKPHFDERKKRITKGYTILQPRVSVSLARDARSVYRQIHGNEPGLDPYTRLTSDVYQDLFGEGSFIGKGIYDVDAFLQAIGDRFPENRILSHDLLEGCYSRSGLVSDIQLYEEYPISYSADVNRRHRWVRGDWQVGYWMLPFAPDRKNKLRKNPVSILSKWKIFDNLRRSLVAISLTALLILGWTTLHMAAFFTLAVFLIVMLPSFISSVWGLLRKSKEMTLWQHLVFSANAIKDGVLQHCFMFICLPYEAYYNADAILRTVWRMLISHRRLLEWTPSRNHEHTSDRTIAAAYRSMWIGPFLAVLTFEYILLSHSGSGAIALPVLLSWMLSPFVAWWVSKPFVSYQVKLTGDQTQFLRMMARKNWAFFEAYAGADDNWLPPDNYQEVPGNVVAHRTSPTNIGLSLLANLAAYDFGFIVVPTLVNRCMRTFNTLKQMERFQGHLYNWYDTVTLQPLYPRYVSTVDSGNMAGHLLTLRQGLLSLTGEPLIRPRIFDGFGDTLSILEKESPRNELLDRTKKYLDTVRSVASAGQSQLSAALRELLSYAKEIVVYFRNQPDGEAYWWANALQRQCEQMLESFSKLYAWVSAENVPALYRELYSKADGNTLEGLAALYMKISGDIEQVTLAGATPEENAWLERFRTDVMNASAYATEQLLSIKHMADLCADFATLDYEVVYDKSKHLLSIGYNVEDHRMDLGYYDLLASEASLCCFVAIAQGKIPQESWFALGRLLTNAEGKPILLSWSGSMFEYLMPLLVMPDYEQTLIHQTRKSVVARQMSYAAERNVPWGISESGYNMVDANLNYQYQAFGVPGLGLKRGLADNLVIAPYASALALMVSPEEACQNMQQLSELGFEGRYGHFESIDYTPSRLSRGQQYSIIQSYMSHHQGMSFLSIAFALLDQPMQKRFSAELQFEATILLLQERIPKTSAYYTHVNEIATVAPVVTVPGIRIYTTPHTPIPEVQLLSNGRYHVMVTNSGGGYSRWKDLAVTRWREDTTSDNWGTFCYIRDTAEGVYWSNTFQPTQGTTKRYEVTFTQGRADFRRFDYGIETHTEIVVSPEDDIEIRRLNIINRSRKRRTLDVTSYCEVVLNSGVADAIHPAFSSLFIQTEILEHKNALLSTRRPRSVDERPPFMFHLMSYHGSGSAQVSFESDRSKFIGRGRSVTNPVAMSAGQALSNSRGSVLDPIASIRTEFVLEPDETVVIDLISGISDTREGCMALVEKYQEKHLKDRVFELTWTHSQVLLRQINATEADAQNYAQLAGSIIYSNPLLRAEPSVIMKNRRGQPGLWGYSISGDIPIVLLEIESQENLDMVKQMVQAHAYWRSKGLAADLVIINEDHGGYRQVLQNMIMGLISTSPGIDLNDKPGAIFVRAADQVSTEDRVLLQAVARINLSDKAGTLDDFLNRKNAAKNTIPYIQPLDGFPQSDYSLPMPEGLLFFNGKGGFTADGKEYCISTHGEVVPPAPWVNVLANPMFGTIISECGQSYTWVENAHEFRLTPWENDPVCDKGGETYYLRDEETGAYWSPARLPSPGNTSYIVRYGFGYANYQHMEHGIYSEMTVFVDLHDPVKFIVIKLVNHSGRQRRLSVTGYVDWVLGDLKPKTAMHVITEADQVSNALFARNSYNKEFDPRTAFYDTDDRARGFTADRTEFLGRNGTLAKPDGMLRTRLSGRTGAAMDPCAALQTTFFLAPDQEREVVFRLGAGADAEHARQLALKYKGLPAARESLQRTKDYWTKTLGAVRLSTPDKALNLIANGWLVYQTIVCRLWARSGYYQSGGAFGFRDQLQDVLSVLYCEPGIARNHILLAASRQFSEGDVQHWWHPPTGRGVRTRCSDDMLWLPYVTAAYVLKTGDKRILDEKVQFIEGRPLNKGENSYYDLPVASGEFAPLYVHCKLAIEFGLKFGAHGLPLIGAGDWNDGMDLVGHEGKGESTWLGFFLYDVLSQFYNVATLYGDAVFAERCQQEASTLRFNLDKNGWDGNWYRRAYFDDGTPLGSKDNDECQIDSISQSWSVISEAGEFKRSRAALAKADKMLVRPEKMLIQLLDPPFDKSALNPGYIKGYVPGIRENGGQYTHAAVWMIMAYAATGNAKRAWELLQMVNPVNHGSTAEQIARYKTEPYVVAADVYSVAENSGRGGWTWYTGSAGWMYQLIVDWLMGIRKEGDRLFFSPCLPQDWETCVVDYKYMDTVYRIEYKHESGQGSVKVVLDGREQSDYSVPLVNDGAEHRVEVCLFVNKESYQQVQR